MIPAAPKGSGSSGSDFENVAGQLAEVIDQSPGDVLRAVAHALDGVIAALRAATGGTTNDGISAAVSTFARVRDAAADSAHALNAATNHLTDYLHALGLPASTVPTTPTTTRTPPVPPSNPDTDARRLLAELPPRSPRDKTRGLWVDDHGERHHLTSGEHDPWHKAANEHAAAIGLVDRGKKLAVSSHVEVKFAMRMRTNNIKSATIVVNQTPCPGFLGCQRRLSQFLAEGSELTVYGPGGYRRTFHGRGR